MRRRAIHAAIRHARSKCEPVTIPVSLKRRLVTNPSDRDAVEQSYPDLIARSDPDDIERMAARQMVVRADTQFRARYVIGLCGRLREGARRRRTAYVRTASARAVDVAGQRVLFANDDVQSRAFFDRLMDGDRIHEPGVVKYLCHRLGPDRLFVDVGAHIGYLSCVAAALGASVVALEIQKSLVPLIERNALLNNQHRVHALNAAAGDHDGLTAIMRYDASLGAQTLAQMKNEQSFTADLLSRNADWVPILRLDTLFADRNEVPDVIKIDVEGAELQVLSGAVRLLGNGHTRFVVEYHVSLLSRFDRGGPGLFDLFPESAWKAYHLEDHGMVPLSREELGRLIDPRTQANTNPSLVFEPTAQTRSS
ncbi:MAG: FkbM family methyltransferase [Alphaproteobacteria bacterium]|nr:FkbM family methyltransferase [Alphaproteobacteria bacterium]